MKNKIVFLFLIFSFLLITNQALASTSNGTIDSVFHYAWGENIGWVDLQIIGITDTVLSGSAYGENIGWIDLSTITNNNQGTLSGYAWGENVGWVDFSQVIIGSDGVFTGQAYGENIGWISFGTGNNKVVTDWRPVSTRVIHSSGSSGGCLPGYPCSNHTPPVVVPAITPIVVTPTACNPGEKFSSAIGLLCTSFTPNPSLAGSGPSACLITLTLRQGSRGTEVKCLQTRLSILSDGLFGPITKQTVTIFQKANNLQPDGIVGPLTRAKLK